MSHYRSGGDDGTFPNPYAMHHNCTMANPHIVFNQDWSTLISASEGRRNTGHIDTMITSNNRNMASEHAPLANGQIVNPNPATWPNKAVGT